MVICEKAVRLRFGDRSKGTRTKTKQKHFTPEELTQDDCWIGLSLAQESGLIMSMRVGKHTDQYCSVSLLSYFIHPLNTPKLGDF